MCNKFLLENLKGRDQLRDLNIQKNNVKMDKAIGWEGADWFILLRKCQMAEFCELDNGSAKTWYESIKLPS